MGKVSYSLTSGAQAQYKKLSSGDKKTVDGMISKITSNTRIGAAVKGSDQRTYTQGRISIDYTALAKGTHILVIRVNA
ncbi:hypothetical protein AB0I28_12715 [Phytomonospora sp. NPDC050363]|uniref:hypothetical protein n=1 Tax=Phytomonospora sp. NPDC050363 TaxID=3155642 RepID=UPI00340D2BC5